MKIAIIVRRLNVNGGTQRQAVSLARELKLAGHEVTLYTLSYNPRRCYPHITASLNVRFIDEDLRGIGGFRGWLARRSGAIRENFLAKRLALTIDSSTDVLNPHDGISNRVAHYFRKHVRPTPAVWSMNDVPLFAWVRTKARLIGENKKFGFSQRLAMALQDFMERWVFIPSQDAIAVLDDYNKALVKKYLGREAVVVRSGIDAREFRFKERKAIAGKTVRLLSSGILFPHRRFEDVIEAVKLLVEMGFDPSLTIVGDVKASPDYHHKLLTLIAARNLEERVFFRGEVSESELAEAYRSHDVFVFANVLQTWGLSVFEAVISGLPVIVSRGAGVHEVLTDLKHCVLVNPNDPANIARAIRELILNPRLYENLSANGAAYIRSNFSWRDYAQNMLKVFNEVREGFKL